MVEFVSGYIDIYGKLHSTREAAEEKNNDFNCHQDMYKLVDHRIPIVKWPTDENIAEYIVRNYKAIKQIMERYGR